MVRGVSGESTWRRSRIVLPVASPGAGLDWSLTVPAGHLYQLLAVTATLVTSAAVANRAVGLVLSDDRNPFLTIPAGAVQAASLTGIYSWAVGANPATLGIRSIAPIPDLILPTAWSLATSTLLIDAADQWSAVRLHLLDVTARRGRLDLDTVPDMLVGVVDMGPDLPA